MKKKKKRMLSIAGMCCCGFLAAATAISGSSAYQTDHDEVVNIIRTGNNTIIPDEDFPTPTPVPSSGSVVKKVRAKNTGDVPCYVRAYITCSEPVKEFTGLDTTNWGDILPRLCRRGRMSVRPARTLFLKVKVLSAPVSGKHIANKARVSIVRWNLKEA